MPVNTITAEARTPKTAAALFMIIKDMEERIEI
jgi:hypothetical protein